MKISDMCKDVCTDKRAEQWGARRAEIDRAKVADGEAADRGPASRLKKATLSKNMVNDCRSLSWPVIDSRPARPRVFIDAIVYLFGAQRLPDFTDSDRAEGAAVMRSTS